MQVKKRKKHGRPRLCDGHESDFVGFFVPSYLREALGIAAADEGLSVSKYLRNLISKKLKVKGSDYAKKS